MTEEPKVDEVAGDGAVSPSGSTVSDPVAAPIADVVTKEEFSQLQKELRGLQGRQDKADTTMDGYGEAIARYQDKIDSGLKPAEAKTAMAAEDKAGKNEALFARLENFLDGAGGEVVDSGVNTPTETTRLIQELELDANKAEVNAILGQGLDPDSEELALRRLASKPKNAASAPPPKTPEPVRPPNEAALVEQYVKELSAVGTSKVAAAQVREKYEKLGVNTGGVSFN